MRKSKLARCCSVSALALSFHCCHMNAACSHAAALSLIITRFLNKHVCVCVDLKTHTLLLGSAGAFGADSRPVHLCFQRIFPLCCKRLLEVLILLLSACCVCTGFNLETVRLFADRFDVVREARPLMLSFIFFRGIVTHHGCLFPLFKVFLRDFC